MLGLLAIGLSVALLACGLIGALAGRAAPNTGLVAARARWDTRTFNRYQLAVQEETPAGGCRQELQIQDERIVAVVQNQCVRLPSWTVSNLFTWAAGLNDHVVRCYPSDVACVCHATYTAHASFDPQLGYPHQITYQWKLQTNWAYFGHWERMLRTHELPNCEQTSRSAAGYIAVTVISITPIH
jgi:hypothetical protein